MAHKNPLIHEINLIEEMFSAYTNQLLDRIAVLKNENKRLERKNLSLEKRIEHQKKRLLGELE